MVLSALIKGLVELSCSIFPSSLISTKGSSRTSNKCCDEVYSRSDASPLLQTPLLSPFVTSKVDLGSSDFLFTEPLNFPLMDIFSAIIVIVPLIAPLGAHFGIEPVHLAIIFIANLELGFLTPPVGMNLFLSAYRFNEPMSKIYQATLPFFIIKLFAVGLITYLPILTLALFK